MAFFWSSGKSGTSVWDIKDLMALIGTLCFRITIINNCKRAPPIRNEKVRGSNPLGSTKFLVVKSMKSPVKTGDSLFPRKTIQYVQAVAGAWRKRYFTAQTSAGASTPAKGEFWRNRWALSDSEQSRSQN